MVRRQIETDFIARFYSKSISALSFSLFFSPSAPLPRSLHAPTLLPPCSVRHATGIRADVRMKRERERDTRRPADKDRIIGSETYQRRKYKPRKKERERERERSGDHTHTRDSACT